MESKIRANLSRNIVGKTTILITHKSSILSLVDRLIILDNGKLVIDGKRDEVLKKLNAPRKVVRRTDGK
jgi:ATP-binding cassette subfamily C protein LapB